MTRSLLLSTLLFAPPAAAAVEAPKGPQMISLGCVEALAAIGQADRLNGIFSFIAEKDAPAAFADLLVRDSKAMKKFLAKVEKDKKEVLGVGAWDREALQFVVSIYGSPLAQTLEKPSDKTMSRLTELANSTALSLEEMTARRRK